MPNFFAGLVVGIILLQTAIFAPTIFTTIEAAPAGKLLRALFPKFFKLLAILGLVTLLALGLSEQASPLQYIIAGLTVGFPVVCVVLVPVTNRATDNGDKETFKRLHTLSVVLTMLVLAGNIALPWL